MNILNNLNLLSVALAILALDFLGFLVYLNDRKNFANKAFLFFALIDTFWNIFNYLSYQFSNVYYTLWLARVDIFFAVWHGFAIFNFIYIFTRKNNELSKKYKFILIPFVIFVSLLTLTPLVFQNIEQSLNGFRVVKGPLIPLFGATVTGFVFYGIFLLIKKRNNAYGLERSQYEFVLTGISITFILHIIFNFIFPSFLNDLRFISLGGIFTFPFIGFTAYAILKHKLFNLKVIAAEFLTFAIWIALFAKIFISESGTDRIIGIIIFLFTFVFGSFLIRSVLNEVKMREKTEALYKELREADEKLKKIDEEKSEFVFLVSHQLRTPMTVIKGYISMMMEGDFGEISSKLKEVLQKVYISNDRLVKIINDLLDLSRIERGKMDYSLKEQQFERIVSEAIVELTPYAKDKDLKITFNKPKKGLPSVLIDEDYTRQVVVNLIDNAIKYSDKGEVKVKIEKKKDNVLLSIKDKGMGISEDMISHLFHRYSRDEKTYSKASRGMGLGLYIAKKIITDQHGRIWAESKGQGMGATFFVEFGASDESR